ncbi:MULTISPECIES: glycosyl hydrolase 115 family protein [Alteromonas]|uniref:glycosyl hydrolase 115 family protein n=1 Tax=Alteromonas TaxID=226 RepID=UPI0023558B40|nr:glycosyl hydrolase 115 family protein [Alteromonas australica]|tara:strand:- start:4411 stop:7299 length:2889 start_codon:yes stop_codon:yes gene_type:complete
MTGLIRALALLIVFNTACLVGGATSAIAGESFVHFEQKSGDFPFAVNGQPVPLLFSSAESKGVIMAIEQLKGDIKKVTGNSPLGAKTQSNQPAVVIIGTLDKSPELQTLERQGKIDFSRIRGEWEAYHIEVIPSPMPNVGQALVIAGSDRRGTTFGIYELARQIGVSPWYWWADVPVSTHNNIYIRRNTQITDRPKVKYRGIFLNDEAPALTGYVQEKFGNYNSEFYQHVFELLLRLKANFLWPAMWNNAFSIDDPMNAQLAHDMGIVMSTSHHEPMMRADKEWNWFGEGEWDYATNQDNLYQFWRDGAKRHKNFDSMFTLGMRGQEDTPMSETQNIALLEKVVADQRKILSDVFTEKDVSEVPQVWTLYKEVQGYYENGMRVPDDVTLLWADDNWGNIRRLPTPEERKRKGGAGVYYHFDYVGGPRSYRWMNTIPIAKIWEQMQLAYQFEAREIWVTNVGDLKPMEYPIDFFLNMAWDPARMDTEALANFGTNWAAQQFGEKYAKEIAEIVEGYTRHNGRRKPELVEPSTYSIYVYDEAHRIGEELAALESKAKSVYQDLQASHQDAFFQLVLHPIKAVRIVHELNYNLAKNRLYAGQERASANDYARRAREWFLEDAALEKRYHNLNNGRWNHFMSQPHIGYTSWNNPPVDTMPVVHINQPNAVSDMGVTVEGSTAGWPQDSGTSWPHNSSMELTFDTFGQSQRYIEIYNKGTLPFEFNAEVSAPWISLSQTQGKVEADKRVMVSIDWPRLTIGHHSGHILVSGAAWGHAKISVVAIKRQEDNVKGFVEADGYISIEAANTQRRQSASSASWYEIPLHGRTRSSMAVSMPIDDTFANDLAASPVMEYDLHLFSSGNISIQTIVAPSLNFVPERGMRFAIALGEEPPQIIDILKDNSEKAWQESVKNGVRYAMSSHNVKTPGAKTLKIYAIDPGVVIQKVIVNTGGLKPSYLGPQQSVFID